MTSQDAEAAPVRRDAGGEVKRLCLPLLVAVALLVGCDRGPSWKITVNHGGKKKVYYSAARPKQGTFAGRVRFRSWPDGNMVTVGGNYIVEDYDQDADDSARTPEEALRETRDRVLILEGRNHD